ncbi:hypothetical protein T09_6467 [Trichinella sp. T9]|nr:hypothetical protein T09_6467 [Trichinella sp. T9]
MEDAKARKLHLRGSAIEAKYDDVERSLKNGSHARRVFCTSITNDDILMRMDEELFLTSYMSILGLENLLFLWGLLDVSVKWSTHIEGHFPLLESSTPVDDQITDSSPVRRCTVAGYRAGKQKKQPKNDEKYKLDLPWIDQTPKSPAGHGLVSPKGEQPKSSRLHFNHVTLRGGWTKLKVIRDESLWPDLVSCPLRRLLGHGRRLSSLSSFFEWNELAANQMMYLQVRLAIQYREPSIFLEKHIIRQLAELILSSASGLLPVASNKMVRVHERGGGSSTPLSTPSNNRARSARNRNAFYGFFMNLPEELFLTLWINIFGIVNLLFLWDTNMYYSSQLRDALFVQNKMWSGAVTQLWRMFAAT